MYSITVPASDLDQSEDGKENEDENSKVSSFEANLTLHNVFQTEKIILAEKLVDSRVSISLDTKGKLVLRDIVTAKQVNYLDMETSIAAAYIRNFRIFIGTTTGSFRIFDIDHTYQIKEVFNIKLSRKQEIKKFFVIETILFIVFESRIVLYNLLDPNQFTFYGFFITSKAINDITVFESSEHLRCVCLFDPGLLVEYKIEKSRLLLNKAVMQINDSAYDVFGSKVDINLTHISHDKNGDFIYCVGSDLYLRKYNFPKEYLGNLEQRVNFPSTPIEELQLMNDVAAIMFIQDNILYVGSVSGDVVIYDLTSKDKEVLLFGCSEFSGISYMSRIQDDNSFFLGTFNGCVVLHNISITNLADIDSPLGVHVLEKCTFISDIDIEYYEDLITRDKLLREEQKRKDIEEEILTELVKLKQEYKDLLSINEVAEPQKRIGFDEFCIDLEERESIEQTGKDDTAKIYRNAEKYTNRNELIHAKLKEQTFDKMDEHLRTITALDEKLLVFNFPQPKITPNESKNLSKIKLLRRLELRENRWRKENNLQVGMEIEEIVLKHSNFIINGVPERPQLILTDYHARDAELREYIEDQRKKKEAMLNMQNGITTKKKKFEIKNKERKRKRGNFLNNNKGNTMVGTAQNQKINTVVSDVKEIDIESWLIMYPSIELLSRFKKVNQIMFIKNVNRLIKREFNTLFSDMVKIRNKKKDALIENFKKIDEITQELVIIDVLKEPKVNIIER